MLKALFKATISLLNQSGNQLVKNRKEEDDRTGSEPRNRFDKEITTPVNYAHPRVTNGAIDPRSSSNR